MLTMLERMPLTCCVLPQGKAPDIRVFVYEIYRLSDIQIQLMLLINLRMRFQQIAFILKRIVPPGQQETI